MYTKTKHDMGSWCLALNIIRRTENNDYFMNGMMHFANVRHVSFFEIFKPYRMILSQFPQLLTMIVLNVNRFPNLQLFGLQFLMIVLLHNKNPNTCDLRTLLRILRLNNDFSFFQIYLRWTLKDLPKQTNKQIVFLKRKRDSIRVPIMNMHFEY